MKLNANSLNAKLYCWFYGERKNKLPNNLCPYFWKLVIAWVLLIPYSIFCIPQILIETFDKSYENGDESTFARIGISCFVYFALFLLLCMGVAVGALFTIYPKHSFFYEIIFPGCLVWLVIIVVALYFGVKALFELIKDSRKVYDEDGYRIYKEKKPNLAVEFVKAKYNKYCPKIDWANKDEREDY